MLMAAAVPMQAQAATATAALQVTASVIIPSVNVTVAGPLGFGGMLVNQTANATTSFDVTATNNLPYTISLGAGTSGTNTFSLVHGAGNLKIKYNLYSDSTKATAYLPDIANGPVITNKIGTGVAQTYGLYSDVTMSMANATQTVNLGITNPYSGNYADTITITVTY